MKPHYPHLSGPIRANRFSFRKNLVFANRPSKTSDSSEEWTRIARISMERRRDLRESGQVLQK